MFLFAGLATALGLASGCTIVDSTDVKTSGIWAHFVVEQSGDDTVWARGVLRVGGATGTIVDLSADEHLEVNGVRMTEWVEPITGYHWSRGSVSPDPGDQYDLAFVRIDEVVTTTLTLPALPAITGLDPPAVVQTNERITVFWDHSEPGDGVDITVDGDCITGQSFQLLADTGSFETDWLEDASPAQPSDCQITVTVARENTRGVDPTFGGGYSEVRRLDSAVLDFDTILN
jgi:hypothetical protein